MLLVFHLGLESMQLSCSLADQGIKIRIRKDIWIRKKSLPPSSTNNADTTLPDEDPEALPITASSSGLSPGDGCLAKCPQAASDLGKGKGKFERTTKRSKLMNTLASQNASDEQGSSMDSWSVLPSTCYVPSQPA